MMQVFDYQILEYVKSELQPHGIPFAVILRSETAHACTLTGWVLYKWKSLLNMATEAELIGIQHLFNDLQYYSQQPRTVAEQFFNSLAALSVGSVRISSFGTCTSQELEMILRMSFRHTIKTSTLQDAFHNLTR